MSMRYKGGVISATPPTTSAGGAPGTWTLKRQMQAIGSSLWTGIPDAYYKYVTLLLPGNGTNGAQNNTFLDSSSNNFTITRNGNTTQGTFSPYGSLWSNYFDGSGDYLTVADNATLEPGSSDFTIECWVYPTATGSYLGVFSKRATNGTYSPVQVLINSGTMELDVSTSGSSWAIATSASASPPLNQWSHIAVVRNGTASNNIKLYLNGTPVVTGSVSSTALFDNSSAWAVGADAAAGTGPFAGYISNFRYVKGTAVYTGDFTPPTTPLTAITNTSLLTCQSNRFIDNSSNAFAITRNGDVSVQRFSPFSPTTYYAPDAVGGSGYFDGSGDYLSLSQSTAMTLGTGDFTVEAWVYPTVNAPTFWSFIDCRGSATNIPWAAGLRVVSGSMKGEFFNGTSIQGTIPVLLNTWTHVAFVRSGTAFKSYINGVLDINTTMSTNLTAGTTQYVGAIVDPAYSTGYMTDLRIVKGTAIYTSAFTPPSAPLTAVTNTQLLLGFTNAAIIDNAMMNDLETVGNAQTSTTQSKWGGSSMYFDGTGDYLTPPASQNLTFNTGDFTIEMWVYAGNQGANSARMMGNGAGAGWGANKWVMTTYSTAGYVYQFNWWNYSSGSSGALIGTSASNTSTWTHVAVTRNGNTFRLFVNGTVESTVTSSTSVDGGTAAQIRIGSGGISGDTDWAGYIDDIRITKGYARYTANFTVPAGPFTPN